MTRTVTVEIPIPPPQLKPNARVHYMAKAKATKKHRAVVGMLALAARPLHHKPFAACSIRAEFYFKQRRRRDPDNLIAWLKSAFDGLRDAGIIVDDWRVTHEPPIVSIGFPRVVLRVSEVS